MNSIPTLNTLRPAQPENTSRLASFGSIKERTLDHWQDYSWFVEHENDELEGYVFTDDAEVLTR